MCTGVAFRLRLHDTESLKSMSKPLQLEDMASAEANPFFEPLVNEVIGGGEGHLIACMLWFVSDVYQLLCLLL